MSLIREKAESCQQQVTSECGRLGRFGRMARFAAVLRRSRRDQIRSCKNGNSAFGDRFKVILYDRIALFPALSIAKVLREKSVVRMQIDRVLSDTFWA